MFLEVAVTLDASVLVTGTSHNASPSTLNSQLSTLNSSEDPQASGLKSQVSDPALDSHLPTSDADGARERISHYMGPDIVAKAHLELYQSLLDPKPTFSN